MVSVFDYRVIAAPSISSLPIALLIGFLLLAIRLRSQSMVRDFERADGRRLAMDKQSYGAQNCPSSGNLYPKIRQLIYPAVFGKLPSLIYRHLHFAKYVQNCTGVLFCHIVRFELELIAISARGSCGFQGCDRICWTTQVKSLTRFCIRRIENAKSNEA